MSESKVNDAEVYNPKKSGHKTNKRVVYNKRVSSKCECNIDKCTAELADRMLNEQAKLEVAAAPYCDYCENYHEGECPVWIYDSTCKECGIMHDVPCMTEQSLEVIKLGLQEDLKDVSSNRESIRKVNHIVNDIQIVRAANDEKERARRETQMYDAKVKSDLEAKNRADEKARAIASDMSRVIHYLPVSGHVYRMFNICFYYLTMVILFGGFLYFLIVFHLNSTIMRMWSDIFIWVMVEIAGSYNPVLKRIVPLGFALIGWRRSMIHYLYVMLVELFRIPLYKEQWVMGQQVNYDYVHDSRRPTDANMRIRVQQIQINKAVRCPTFSLLPLVFGTKYSPVEYVVSPDIIAALVGMYNMEDPRKPGLAQQLLLGFDRLKMYNIPYEIPDLRIGCAQYALDYLFEQEYKSGFFDQVRHLNESSSVIDVTT